MVEIVINRFNKVNYGTLRAFVDVLYGKVIIKGFKLIQGREDLFLSVPSEKGKDGKYFDTIIFLDATDKMTIEKMAIGLYNKDNK